MIALSLSLLTAGCGGGPAGTSVLLTSNPSGSGSAIAVIGAAPPSPRATLNPTIIDFGSVPVGSLPITQQVTLSNFGNASVNVTSAPPLGTGFSHDLATPATLAPGQSIQFNVSFSPAAAGDVTASLAIVSTALDSPTILKLFGKGTALASGSLISNPSSITFGDTVVGTSTATTTVTLTNAGGTPVTISSFAPPGPDFVVTDLVTSLPPTIPPNIVLTPGQSRSFAVSYTPTTSGPPPLPESMAFTSDAATPITSISLQGGTRIAQDLRLSVTPAAINFGDVPLSGPPDSRQATVTNTGNFGVNITGSTITPAGGGFSVTGLTLGALAPGVSRTFTVQFLPTALGAVATRTISLTSNATSSNSITADGTGIPQPLGTLSFSPATVDFGNVVVGTTPSPSRTVTLTNTGNAALTISSQSVVPAGSGFTVTGFTTGPLAAGASRTFDVQFAPSGGPANPNLSIVSTNSSNPTQNIPLSGNGVLQNLQLTFNPTNIGFGDVVNGTTDSRPVTVTNTGNFDVNITDPNPTAPAGFNVTGLTLGPLGPGSSRTFTVQFAPTLSQGYGGSISLTSNPAVSPNSFTVSGTGVSPGQLNLNPSSINFGTVVVGNFVTRSITVMNTGGAPVDVTSIAVTAGAAVYSIGNFVPGPSPPTQTVAPGGSITFTATFTPNAASSPAGTITVNSTAGNPAVSLSGTGVAQTLTLTVSPPSLAFGNVTVGTNVSQVVILTNTGNTSVTGIAASNPGGAFSVTASPPASLAPGATGNFTVRFSPASVGPAPPASVSVTSNAPAVSVPLTGTGTATPVASLGLNPTSLNFGSVVVGNTTAPQTVTMTNTGSGPAVTINSLTSNPPGVFTAVIVGAPLPRTLTNPGDTATFTVQFTPAAPGAVSPPGSVLVTTTANSPSVTLNGTGLAATSTLSVSPTNLDFGSVNVGSNSAGQQVTITNTGNTTVTGITATPSAGFNLTLLPPASLAPGISGTFTVRFSPTAAGVAPAGSSVVVTSSATNSPNTVSLSGTGVTPVCTLTVSPTNINFGNVLVGGSGVTQNLTLVNSCASNINLTINPLTGTGAATYSVLNLGLPLTLPFTQTLTPGQSSGFTIRFLPTAVVTSDASLTIDSNATNSPNTVSLTGTGTVGVSLSWDASTSVVVGYNVYRSNVSGVSYVRLNASVIPGLNYTDSTAVAGNTYFYVATAVDADGVESILSNELRVVLP